MADSNQGRLSKLPQLRQNSLPLTNLLKSRHLAKPDLDILQVRLCKLLLKTILTSLIEIKVI